MKRIIYSLLFAAGTLFAGCSDDDTQAPLNTPIQEGNNLYGVVTDPNGAPVGGIVVSDGFSCVATDANGVYQMPRHADAFHVFYRIPADREIPMSEGRPCFWQRLSKTQERYDFVLMPQQAVETDFKLVCIAVNGQKLSGCVLSVVVFCAEKHGLRLFLLIDNLVARVSWFIIKPSNCQNALDAARDPALKFVCFQIKRNIACLTSWCRLVSSAYGRCVKRLKIRVQLFGQHINGGLRALKRCFNTLRCGFCALVAICMGNVGSFKSLHKLCIVNFIHAAAVRQHPINQVALIYIVDHVAAGKV